MWVTVIPIVVGALGMPPNGKRKEELEIRKIETIRTTALLKSARIPRRVLETFGDTCNSDFCEKLPIKPDVENLQGEK